MSKLEKIAAEQLKFALKVASKLVGLMIFIIFPFFPFAIFDWDPVLGMSITLIWAIFWLITIIVLLKGIDEKT